MKRFLAAIRFLTIVPIPGMWGTAEDDLVNCVPFLPAVGLILGLLAAAFAWAAGPLCPPMLLSALVIVLLISVSGALHMDGLSDTADAFLSSRSRERMLEIMKDSHVGAMGVIAIAAALLVKFAAVASLSGSVRWQTVVLMPLAGRCAIVLNMAILNSARPGGLGALLCKRNHQVSALWAVAVLLGIAWWLLRVPGLAVAGTVFAVALVFAWQCRRKIGGSTGDTFGAVCELCEIVPPVVLCMTGGR